MQEMIKAPNAPLFRDPVHDAPADPMLIWNREEQAWWMLYTARRADGPSTRYEWLFGTGIGVASSTDGGRTFTYRGELDLHVEPGHNTYWAPDVVWEDGVYHMYVTFSRGVSANWHHNYYMAHLTATNMWEWRFEGFIANLDKPAFDASCCKMEDGTWRMWYRGKGRTLCIESTDLYHWRPTEACPVLSAKHEGPNVFRWKGCYWMIADTWKGQDIYRSDDANTWELNNRILDKPGKRPCDQGYGQHASVLVNNDRAFIVYFTNVLINRDENNCFFPELDYEARRALVQIAELEFDGERIVCDRDKAFNLDLQPESAAE